MTNQASELFELCKKVYELTEWRGEDGFITTIGGKWIRDYKKGWYDETIEADNFYPLYTSDYLLEKLPDTIGLYRDELSPTKWTAACEDGISYGGKHVDCGDEECGCENYYGESDTPLKALLKLTIALSEAGELK